MVRELLAGESLIAAAALLELRPHLETEQALAARVDGDLRAGGYRVLGSFEPGEEAAAAAAGFRIAENLHLGRHLYVDDLVTRAAWRGQGHADALLAWLEDEARAQGCRVLHLDSGVQAEREDAHRFYFRHGMRIASYHFSRTLN